MKKLLVIFLFLATSMSLYAFGPVFDLGTHMLLSAQTEIQSLQSVKRAQEALNSLSEAIEIYDNGVKQFNKLKDVYKEAIKRNKIIDAIKRYKGDPKDFRGTLKKTKKLLYAIDHYSDALYKPADALGVDKNFWKIFEGNYGTMNTKDFSLKKSVIKAYDQFKKRGTAYLDYCSIVQGNTGKKRGLLQLMDRTIEKIDSAKTEIGQMKYEAELNIQQKRLQIMKDEEDNSYKNIQALQEEQKIADDREKEREVDRYNYQRKVNNDTFKSLSQDDAMKILGNFEKGV